MKAWQSHPSFAFALHFSLSMFSLSVCCRMQAAVAQCTSASFIASMAWASFKCIVTSVLSSSSLWWESIVAQVVSNHSRAMFILSCRWRSSLVTPASPTLGRVQCWGIKEMPTISSVCGRVSWSSWGTVWVRLGVSPGVAIHGDYGKVATRAEMAESVSFCPRGSSVPSVEGGVLGPLMVAPSWVYYVGRLGWRPLGRFAAATPRPPGDAGLWPWQCLRKAKWYQPESGLVLVY